MLAVANKLALDGFAVVAIDLPLHGILSTDAGVGLLLTKGAAERNFALDLVSQNADGSIAASGADGVVDSSGRHYINFTSLLTARDNTRQAVADLFALTSSLTDMSYDNVVGGDFDTSKIYFVGHSLGGIVGSMFLRYDSRVRDAVLAMPGGGILKMLDGSPRFGPEIRAGLESVAGLKSGTAEYDAFMIAAQTVLDSSDPINVAADVSAGRGVLMFEVLGDAVIPNEVADAPLSGTKPLAGLMGLSATTASVTDTGVNLTKLVKFGKGHHGSVLTPTDANDQANADSAAVYAEMQSLMAEFISKDGKAVTLNNTALMDLNP
ncbi:MAG: hypothetical protein OEW58_07980 [Gammaproteobacteria bacterium]|nr:hypothetical protein [Gammaproteobacteria bacterium]